MSGQPPPPLPAPGWYPDPEDPGQQQQYWDGARWTDQRLPVKPKRKPLPWWLVVILSLIATVVAAFMVDAILDSGHQDKGMPATTSAQVLRGDDRGTYGNNPPSL